MSKTSDLIDELETLVSEGRNPRTMNLDTLPTIEMLQLINSEDQKVALAIEKSLITIAQAVENIVSSIQLGGRLIYIGAGTSGRLGVLDAVECRPTFSVPDSLVLGLIAGGSKALTSAVEGAEDDTKAGERDLKHVQLNKKDIVVGIAASGRTPYVIGALNYANTIGSDTVCVVCNPSAPLLDVAQTSICINVGPECLTGSTRMKSGSAQKLVLNMLSTATMVKLGKVYENLMVDVNASNKKLEARAKRIVMQATDCSVEQATRALEETDNQVKLAILMLMTNTDAKTAEEMLQNAEGFVRNAILNT